ncbi:hypothetical protein MNBD_GAMMA26-2681 [hydrothermal vent metagenome]|uniref:Uncharacterized protein n=1 Tax=hydrothermal vent metagenome TaxID=652676 RepID=A0A3B1B4V5_9ZZZZ
MARRKIIVLATMVSVLLVGSGWAIAADKAEFVSGCLKAKGTKPGECECMYEETRKTLSPEEAAFLIASTGGDTEAIQKAAGKLSPQQRQDVWSSWIEVVDKCLSL